MKTHRSVWSLALVAALGLSALVVGAIAQARDIAWSVGIASPGVQIGVSNAPAVLYPRPVVVLPAPVYQGHPYPPYYGPPPVVYYGQPQVVYVPAPRYGQAGWVWPGHHHGWGRHGRWHQGGRDRDDDRHGFDRRGAGNGRH